MPKIPSIRLFRPPAARREPSPPGRLAPASYTIGTQCFWSSAQVFVPAGSTQILNAYPYPGFAFTGWSINGTTPTPFLTSVVVNGPVSITPIFVPAKLVSFLTSPLGLQVLVDHTPVPTRTVDDVPNCPNNETLPVGVVQLGFPAMCFGDFYFAPGSTHFVSGVTPQRDINGNWWVFSAAGAMVSFRIRSTRWTTMSISRPR